MPNKIAAVRLQVPVEGEIAERVASLAELMRRSPRWMAAELLTVSIEFKQCFADYLAARIMAWVDIALSSLKPKGSKRQQSTVLMDIELAEETYAYISALGQRLGHAPAKMAGIMMCWAVHESDIVLRHVTKPMLDAHQAVKALRASWSKMQRVAA